MTPEKEAELFVMMSMLAEASRRIESKLDDLGQRVSRFKGRIEEQSKFLQLALASRQVRKTAA